MQVIYQRCCGIDVHKKMLVACLLICTAQGVQKEIQTFSTMLQDLYRLRDWLKAKQCQAVAMAIWRHPDAFSQSFKARISLVIVLNCRCSL